MYAKHTPKALALVLALAIALLCVVPALAASLPEDALTDVLVYLNGKKSSLVFGGESGQSDWKAFALARGGKTVPEAYLASVAAAVEADELNPYGSPNQSTDYARTALVLTAMGYDAGDFAGRNLLEPLTDINFVKEYLPNGPTFALLALNSHSGYESKFPAGYDLALVGVLLDEYTALGWSAGTVEGVDIDATAMALQALSPYYGDSAVKTAVDGALALLAGEQFGTGGFGPDWGDWGHSEDSCSTAQVVTALSVLGKDAATFFPGNVLDALLAYQDPTGGFDTAWGENPFADSQAAYALIAYARYKAGGSGLFNMNDVTLAVYDGGGGSTEPPAARTWLDKLPKWLSWIRRLPVFFQSIIYGLFFGWVWDVIYP